MVNFFNSTTSMMTQNVSRPRLFFAQKPKERIVVAMFFSILACVIIVGNGLVMLAFKMNYRLRTMTNTCIASLALCDFLVGIITMTLYAVITIHYTSNWITSNHHIIHSFFFFNLFCSTASIYHLTAISLERCFSIVAPVRHRAVTATFYYVILFTVWILAAVISLLGVMLYHNLSNLKWCILLYFVLPFLTMFTSYALLFYTITKRSRPNVRANENLQSSSSSRLKTIVTLLIIIGLLLITWIPSFVYNALVYYIPRPLPTSSEDLFRNHQFVRWMRYFNSSLNPFVYAYRLNEFKHSFKAISDLMRDPDPSCVHQMQEIRRGEQRDEETE